MKQLEEETDPKILQALLNARNDYTLEDALENEMILNMGPQHPATHGVLATFIKTRWRKNYWLRSRIRISSSWL